MQAKQDRLAYWQIRPSLSYWKKTPNISKELGLIKNPKTTNKK